MTEGPPSEEEKKREKKVCDEISQQPDTARRMSESTTPPRKRDLVSPNVDQWAYHPDVRAELRQLECMSETEWNVA